MLKTKKNKKAKKKIAQNSYFKSKRNFTLENNSKLMY